jgi:hypothetical protein
LTERRRIERHQMKDRIRDFLLYCETMEFGKGQLSERENNFSQRFSNAILSFCRSLPKSAQTDSILFLMKYGGINLGEKIDFFANYYSPTWSILYWLIHTHTLPTHRLKKEYITNAIKAHSMAMLLHSLDDHLIDNQVSVSPLTLLLRSQAWTIMHRAFSNLVEGVPAGEITVRSFIDDYYSSTQDSKGLKSLDSYCDLFRKQMGIGMIAPFLLSMKITGNSEFTKDLETAYGSFGIAWRLLDDIRDISRDIEKGTHSAVYLCLPKKMRTHWKKHNIGSRDAAKDSFNAILNHLLENGLVDKIKERICTELETAASMVEGHHLIGLTKEFRCLAHPLRNKGRT